MIPQLLCLLHLILLLHTIPSSFSYVAIPKPGCLKQCGKVPIPFPFGVGPDCSLGELFNIHCNNSGDGTSKPYLLPTFYGYEVVEIKLSGQIRVRFTHVENRACYNGSSENGIPINDLYVHSLEDTPYSFSDENWLTAIGCDDLLSIFLKNVDDQYAEAFGGSCVSFCSNATDSSGGGVGFCPASDTAYPPGNGCCLIPIPRGMTRLATKLSNLGEVWRYKKLFSCSYVFLQEQLSPNEPSYSYPLSDLNNPYEVLGKDGSSWKAKTPPIVRLDWRINSTNNCSQEKKNTTSYACRAVNSDCVDYDATVGGYRCHCNKGYTGNPYLTGGCRDIDECKESETNPCGSNSICKNAPGSFTCPCRKGYSGDGRKDSTGCIPSKLIIIIIGVSIGLGFFLLLSICVLLRKAHKKRKNKKRKQEFFKQNGGLLLQQRSNENTIGENQLFHAEELEKATDNFNDSRILGQGGQGIVYKGMLSNGKIVAIKKSKLVDKDQLHQFINEVVILSQINHKNVVKLLGCCLETEVPLLVYEFLPNGTLYDLIHDPKIEFPISWNMRLKIAADIAGALAYLHSASSTPILHRDIKSRNILLDEKYVVKVSDFGISRSLAVDRTHMTTRVQGTFGYFDPEYFRSNQYTDKSDVYSFGVVIVELLTGQEPISSEREEEERSLVVRFLAAIEYNNVDAILDPQVFEQGGKEEVSAVVFLARRCLNLQGKMRPTMKEVATELESLRMSQMPIMHGCEETRVYEAKSMKISDIEYTWTASGVSEVPSSDDYLLKSETV